MSCLPTVLLILVLTRVHWNLTSDGAQQLAVQLPDGTKYSSGCNENLCLVVVYYDCG